LAIQVLYLTGDYAEAMHVYEDEIPFRHSAPLPGGGEGVDLDVDLYLEDLQYRAYWTLDLFEARGRIRADIGIGRTFRKGSADGCREAEGGLGKTNAEASIVVYFHPARRQPVEYSQAV
jgi:hypothetical protein